MSQSGYGMIVSNVFVGKIPECNTIFWSRIGTTSDSEMRDRQGLYKTTRAMLQSCIPRPMFVDTEKFRLSGPDRDISMSIDSTCLFDNPCPGVCPFSLFSFLIEMCRFSRVD